MPLDDLSPLATKLLRENNPSHRVSTQIRSVRVHLASIIAGRDIDQLLVHEPNDLHVIGCSNELHTTKRPIGNETCTTAGLGTPRYHFSFDISNSAVGLNRSPQAKVVDTVDEGRLAPGVLVLGGRITDVVTGLLSTD